MAPSARVKAAFQAMENIGIPKHKTKPALKKLIQLFDKNWDLIEEENYRVLADAIFEYEDTEAAEKQKNVPDDTNQGDVLEEAAPTEDTPERPLKRLRLKHQDQAVQSHGQVNPNSGAFVLKIPKPEPGEPEVSFNQSIQPISGSPQSNVGNKRTESQPLSPQPLGKNKGKQPISQTPHVALRDKRAVGQRANQALQIKEPKPEPGVVLTKKTSQSDIVTLIKPKDEPFTDDMVSVEPSADVPPEHSRQEPHGTSRSVNGNDKGVETIVPSTTEENHLKECDVSGTVSSKIEIAASSLGEVKICLSYNHGLKGHEIHAADVQAIVKEVEDDCIETYKVMNPEFSLTKLMGDICECALQFRRNGDGMMRVKSNSLEAVAVSTGIISSPLNGSLNIVARQADYTANKVSDPLSDSYCQQVCPQSNKSDSDNHCAKKESGTAAGRNPKSLVNPDDTKCLYYMSDITRGKEEVKVSLEKSNSPLLPSFLYISQNVILDNADVMFSLAQIEEKDCCFSCGGDCSSHSPSCNCIKRNGGEFPYTSDGHVREDFLEDCISIVQNPQNFNLIYCKECPLEKSKNEDMLDPCKGHLKLNFIKECWTKCGCDKYCKNRLVQQGIRYKLQVFWTPEGKGWGLRTLEELPKGAFVCEYVGEILTNSELHKRNMKRSNDKHSYSVLLDTEWGSRDFKENELLCLDASCYGNVARFINHRCSDANLIQIPVEVETPKHHYYHIALFTTRKIDAFEELTWDYGVDFDDKEQHVKAFSCLCGSKFCRNMKRSSRSRSALTLC